jgi:hypothetical protein
MRRGFVAVLLLCLAACSQRAPNAGVSPSPSPSPVAAAVTALPAPTGYSNKGPLAVVLHTGDTYLVSVGSANLLTHAWSPLGWIDDTHLVLGNGRQVYVIDTANPSNVLSEVSSLNVPNGIFASVAGVLPTNLV